LGARYAAPRLCGFVVGAALRIAAFLFFEIAKIVTELVILPYRWVIVDIKQAARA